MTTIIPYSRFATLQLVHFVPSVTAIKTYTHTTNNGESWDSAYTDNVEWLELKTQPGIKSVCIYLDQETETVPAKIIRAVGLSLKKGMLQEELEVVLGEPLKTDTDTENQVTLTFLPGGAEPYYLSLTVKNETGLHYLVFSNHPGMIAGVQAINQ